MKRILSIISIFLLMTTLILPPPKVAKAETDQKYKSNQTTQEKNITEPQPEIKENVIEIPLSQNDIVEAESTFTVNLETEKSHKIVNTTSETQVLKVNGDCQYMFNYLRSQTDSNGEEYQTNYIFVNTKISAHFFDNYIKLQPREEITLSNDGASKTLTIPNALKSSVTTINTPAVYKIKVNENTNSKFTNTSSKTLHVSWYDDSIYQDQNPKALYMDSYNNFHDSPPIFEDLYIETNGAVRLSSSKGEIMYYIPYELKKDVVYYNTPLLRKITFKQGDIFEMQAQGKEFTMGLLDSIENNPVKASGYYYDTWGSVPTVDYFNNVNINSEDEIKNIYLEDNDVMSIKINSGEITYYYLYEQIDHIKRVTTEPLSEFEVKPNETMVVKFQSIRASINVLSAPSGNVFDYVVTNGNEISTYYHNYEENIPFEFLEGYEEGNIAHYTNNSTSSLKIQIPSYMKEFISKNQTPAIIRKEIYKDSNIIIDYTKDLKLTTNLNANKKISYDIVRYTDSENLKYAWRNTTGDFSKNEGEKIHLTVNSDEPLKITYPFIYNDKISLTNRNAIEEYKIPSNKNIEMINPKLLHSKIYIDGNYDIVYSKISGEVLDFTIGAVGDVPTKGKEKFNISGPEGKPLKVYVPAIHSSLFKILDKPAVTKYTVKGNVTIGKPSSTPSSKELKFYALSDSSSNPLTLVEYDWTSQKQTLSNITSEKEYVSLNEKCVIVPNDVNTPYVLYYPSVHDSFYTIEGDMNSDKIIDVVDMATQANQYNFTPNNKEFNSLTDLNNDGVIDIYDIVVLGRKI